MSNESKVLDILKIQKTIRKAITNYEIKAKYDEEVLISMVSVDLYLALEEKDAHTLVSAKPEAKATQTLVDIVEVVQHA